MKSHITRDFRELFDKLPESIQQRARKAYRRFMDDPGHPGLMFKKVLSDPPIYSVRISQDYRALGAMEGDDIIWFWIGSHQDYDRLLDQL